MSGEITLSDFLQIWPYVTLEDIRICVEYCAIRKCVYERVINFCQGCSLDRRHAESCSNPDYYSGEEDQKDFLNNHDDDSNESLNGWEIAQELLDKGIIRT
jgi:hypothetical protein